MGLLLAVGCAPHDDGGDRQSVVPRVGTPGIVQRGRPAPVCVRSERLEAPLLRVAGRNPTPLRQAATWRIERRAAGAYDHDVAFDRDGNVLWAHDSARMRFVVSKVAPDGVPKWTRTLEPAELSPHIVAAAPDGSVFVAGTSFASEPSPAGPLLVQLGADGALRRTVATPRVGSSALVPLANRGLVIFGRSARETFSVGDEVFHNTWGRPGSSMDVLSVLEPDGSFSFAGAYVPGILGVAVVEDAIYLGGNFGTASVDYGGGDTRGPGVVAKLGLDGAVAWTRRFDTGLRAVVPAGPGDEAAIVAFGFDSDTTAVWIDAAGCDVDSAAFGDVALVAGAPDGGFVVAALSIAGGLRRIGAHTFATAPLEWHLASIAADRRLAWVHTIDCDNLKVAAAPDGRAAISCLRMLDEGDELDRRYELLVADATSGDR